MFHMATRRDNLTKEVVKPPPRFYERTLIITPEFQHPARDPVAPFANSIAFCPVNKSSSLLTRSRSFAQDHPLAAFFILTFAFSWVLWLAPLAIRVPDALVFRHLVALGAFAPALAALVLTLLKNDPGPSYSWDSALYAWLGVGVVYFLCLPYASTLPSQASPTGWIARALLWAAPALLIGAGLTKRPDLRRLLFPPSRGFSSWTWYAVALLFYPLALAGGYALSLALGAPAQTAIKGSILEVILTVVASLAYITLFGGPLGEEAGWRGWVLPRLQLRFSPLIASLLIALAWTVWRLPLQFNGYYASATVDPWGDLLYRAIGYLLVVFLYTGMYNRTKGDLLACLLLHASVTCTSLFLPMTDAAIGILAASSLAVILLEKMYIKLPASKT
jgi:membrane protease YdiL (CAAX protease family)